MIIFLHLDKLLRKYVAPLFVGERFFMEFPPYNKSWQTIIRSSTDPIRLAHIALAIRTIKTDHIDGAFAEVGVYKGETSGFIHLLAPEKLLYLFDTFEGFPADFRDSWDLTKFQFKDTNLELVKKNLKNLKNIVFRKGIFPDTAKGLEHEKFAFVMLDLDLYKSTLAGLEFFYPRMERGGYIFMHDYYSTEEGVPKAVQHFFQDKPEKPIELPDVKGSVVIRKY